MWGTIGSTPYAVFDLGGRTVRVSLPVNPVARQKGEDGCVVAAVAEGGRDRLQVRFVRQRRVASTVEGLIRARGFVFAADLVDKAAGLLHDKYSDPTAAALGGLLLHRLGRLTERAPWIENLAGDFAWLPDGRVLLAAVLAVDPDPHQRARGLDAILGVTGKRMLYTDGLALQLDLLRRWPGDAGADQRAKALGVLAPESVGVDWSATFLTQYGEAPG